MKTWITVKPHSRKECVETLPDGSLRVSVLAPAAEGKANDAVVALLAKHFKVSKTSVKILVGNKGRRKLLEFGE